MIRRNTNNSLLSNTTSTNANIQSYNNDNDINNDTNNQPINTSANHFNSYAIFSNNSNYTPIRTRTNTLQTQSSSSNNSFKSFNTITNNKKTNSKKPLQLMTTFNTNSNNDVFNIHNNISPIISSPTKMSRASMINNNLLNFKELLEQQNNELILLKKKKDDSEKLRNSAISNNNNHIYSGVYSTHHLEKHNLRIKTNTQIRELDNSIKKIEKNITDIKQQFENFKINNNLLDSLQLTSNNTSTTAFLDQINEILLSTQNDTTMTNNRSLSALNTPVLSYSSNNYNNNTQSSLDNLTLSLSPLHKSPGELNSATDVVASKLDKFSSIDDLPQSISNNLSPLNNNSTTLSKIDPNINNNSPTISDNDTIKWLICTYLKMLQDPNIDNDTFIEKSNEFIDAIKENSKKNQFIINNNELELKEFFLSMQFLLLKNEKLLSASIYRICRYLISSKHTIKMLIDLRIDIFLVISLSKENSFQVEREQAIKLMRKFINYSFGFNKSLIQAIISCIEKSDDNLKYIAIETLLELCFIYPKYVTECQGIRVLENLLQENSSVNLASIILETIFELLSYHKTRKFFLPHFNIAILSTLFSDSNHNSLTTIDNYRSATILISKSLKNNVGLMLFSMNNCKAINELLHFFDLPTRASYLIDVFLDVLRIKPLHYSRKNRMHEKFKPVPSHIYKQPLPIIQSVALIIMILHYCKFEDKLLAIIDRNIHYDNVTQNKNQFSPVLIAKCRYLLNEYLQLAMNLIDLKFNVLDCFIGKDDNAIFEETFKIYKSIYVINIGRNTLGLESINYKQNLKEYSLQKKDNTFNHLIDDTNCRRLLFDSRVLQTKDFTVWNWNVIQELIEGPLTNSSILEEVVKSTKFIRRLLVFYRPLRLRFSNVSRKSKLSQRYIQVGCKFFQLLTSNTEGKRILTDDNKIIPQLASLLFKAMEGHTQGNLFNHNSLKTKLITGYFKFIGILTQSTFGVQVLTKWRFFTIIYKMFDLKSKIAWKFLMLTIPEIDIDYSAHCRTIIGKALANMDDQIRLKATEHIGNQLRKISNIRNDGFAINKQKIQNNPKIFNYLMELLTRQLYDSNPKVIALADQALYEAAISNPDPTNLIPWLRTALGQIVFIGSPILFELLGTSYGFQLLDEIDFIEGERLSWINQKNEEYVSIVESFLSGSKVDHFGNEKLEKSNSLPVHLYESLAKTEEGISLITSCGDLVKFMNIIKKYFQEGAIDEDPDTVVKVKSALWCCGFIGSTELGIGLLDNYSVVEDIIEVAYHASIISIRFTAFYCLGLISKIKEGCEILDEMNWDSILDVYSKPLSIALPKRFDKYLSFPESKWSSLKPYKDDLIKIDKRYYSIIQSPQSININLDSLLKEKNTIENPWSGPDVNDASISNISKIMNVKESIEEEDDEGNDTEIEIEEEIEVDEKDFMSKTNNKKNMKGKALNKYRQLKSDEDDLTRRSSILEDKAIKNLDKDHLSKEDEDKIIERLSTTICELGNHIIANNAIKDITDINNKFGTKIFESDRMFMRVLHLMAKYRFRPHVRKFLFGLFINQKALKKVIDGDRELNEKSIHHHSSLTSSPKILKRV